MKAMILAAGRGKRLRPLTDHTPKPLLEVSDQPLIVYHLLNLKKIGVEEIVINISYLAEQIQAVLGNGSKYGVNITYSYEPTALETGGGIFQALPLLGPAPFIVISADIWTDYPLQNLPHQLSGLAHLIMVDNPSFHPNGDYGLIDNKLILTDSNRLTYANIGLFHPHLFTNCQAGIFPLRNVFDSAIQAGKITAEHYKGAWANVGTLENLQKLNNELKQKAIH